MVRLKKADLFNGYVRTKEPDFTKLAELVSTAKGERSARQFADDCGLNNATISRILNQTAGGPPTDAVIARIALNVEEGSGVTVEQLLEAAGKTAVEGASVPKEVLARIVEESISDSKEADRRSELYKEKQAKMRDAALQNKVRRQIVQESLLERHFQVALDSETTAIEGVEFDCHGDFVFLTDALKDEGLERWAFIMMGKTGNQAIYEPNHYFGMMFLFNPVLMGTRITLMTEDEFTFQVLRDTYRGFDIPASFSVMLIDRKSQSVACEYVFDRSDGVEPVRLFGEGGEIDWQEICGVPDEDEM